MAAIVLAAAASSAASSIRAGAFAAALAGGVGGYLGGSIDRSIFGSKARINQEGSRLTDLMVQASTYGKSIPVVYGRRPRWVTQCLWTSSAGFVVGGTRMQQEACFWSSAMVRRLSNSRRAKMPSLWGPRTSWVKSSTC